MTRQNFAMCLKVFSLCAITVLSSCDQQNKKDRIVMNDNIMLQEWTGPYQGVPSFDKMTPANIKLAMEEAMSMSLENIDKIANNPESSTFENTIVAIEKSDKVYNRVYEYYDVLRKNMSSPEFRIEQKEIAPKISEYTLKILQNKKLFQRVSEVYKASLKNTLGVEEQRLVYLTYKRFEMNGANLDIETKEHYAAIDKKLASLYNKFASNLLHDEENYVTYLTKDQLSGLPEGFTKSAAKIAVDKGEDGKYAIINTRSSIDPFLTYSTERELRKQVWSNYYSRGDNGDVYDNNKLIMEILKLRKERVALLGYDNYAQWRLQDRMAKTPENAIALLEAVWPAAIGRVKEEVKDMQAIADANGDNISIEPWDYLYYAEKVREKKYNLDSEEVKQYLQLDKLTQALFFTAAELFNFEFTGIEVGKVPVFHEDVHVWEVTNKDTGKHIGLWYLDPYARPGKRSGAWAETYRSYTSFEGETNVLASNNSNFVKPASGEAVLISWDDALTLFHEFGHALHYLSANVKYPTLNGGVKDYTEFQSQLLERWLSTDEVINQFLVHHETGESIPAALVEKIKKASTFNQGFKTTEYLASAIMDMKLHLADPSNIDIDQYEKDELAEIKMPQELVMRHRTPQFGHVFASEDYATAYYGYMWADVLTADASEAFAAAPGGFYDKVLTAKLVKYLFAPRNAIDPEDAYRLFRGRDAKTEALLRDRGLPIPKK